MLIFHQPHPPCISFPFFNSQSSKYSIKSQNPPINPLTKPTKTLFFNCKNSTRINFCSPNRILDAIEQETEEAKFSEEFELREELELRDKPSHSLPITNDEPQLIEPESKKPDKNEALAPFLKFFKPRDSLQVQDFEECDVNVKSEKDNQFVGQENKKVLIEYYEPKPGDFVVGVVVSGNENKLDVNIGADMLGTMLTKEVLPLYDKEMESLLCDVERNAEEFMVYGKMGIVKNDDALSAGPGPGRPVVETGTILFAEVLGRTLSGRPLLSTRRFFRRIAWHRVRQVLFLLLADVVLSKVESLLDDLLNDDRRPLSILNIHQLNEPIEVRITEWNTGGLLTRIEGLRAFLPKGELMNRVNNFSGLKENVGRQLHVQISRIDEANNDLILSEREAWEMLHLQEGTLLEGTVRKVFSYGAQIRIGESNRSGLLHISNITRARIMSVSDLLAVDEKVKVLVVKSMFPGKISLSIADLESEPGLFLSNKEKVIEEAEEMAKKYKQKLPAVAITRKSDPLTEMIFDDEAKLYKNWNWFKFQSSDK